VIKRSLYDYPPAAFRRSRPVLYCSPPSFFDFMLEWFFSVPSLVAHFERRREDNPPRGGCGWVGGVWGGGWWLLLHGNNSLSLCARCVLPLGQFPMRSCISFDAWCPCFVIAVAPQSRPRRARSEQPVSLCPFYSSKHLFSVATISANCFFFRIAATFWSNAIFSPTPFLRDCSFVSSFYAGPAS